MGLNDFILDLVCTLFLVFLFGSAAVFISLLSFDFDANNLLLGFLPLLLQNTCTAKKTKHRYSMHGIG